MRACAARLGPSPPTPPPVFGKQEHRAVLRCVYSDLFGGEFGGSVAVKSSTTPVDAVAETTRLQAEAARLEAECEEAAAAIQVRRRPTTRLVLSCLVPQSGEHAGGRAPWTSERAIGRAVGANKQSSEYTIE